MATAPPVTIVITTHNRPELARRAVRSALDQTMKEVEVLVVDDGSEPPFPNDASRTEADGARLRVIRRDRAGGPSAARNAGLLAARGEWVTFLDDDDELAPDMLDRSLAAAQTSGLPAPVAVMSTVMVVDDMGTSLETHRPSTFRRGEYHFLEGRGGTGRVANSLVAPTEVVRAIGGFDEQLAAFQHDDFLLRLNAVASIIGIDDALYCMSAHGQPRVSSDLENITKDMERTLTKHADAFVRYPAARASYMATLGAYHLKAGNWGAALSWSFGALRRDPTQWKTWRYAAAAVGGPASVFTARTARRLRRSWRRLWGSPSGVSWSRLTKRRIRKYSRRALDYPRAIVGAPLSRTSLALVRRRQPTFGTYSQKSTLMLSIYRHENVDVLAGPVAEARELGWHVRLWALDTAAPALASCTVGVGPGAKLPLLNELARTIDLARYEWLVVVDDDFLIRQGSLRDLLSVAEHAGLDLVQPAHTERSHRTFGITLRRPLAVARRTSFVEIGPVFAVRRPWIAAALPFGSHHEMGWGIELEWSDLTHQGAVLGIVDVTAVQHLRPAGGAYRKGAEGDNLRKLLRDRGVASIADMQQTFATWRPWQARAPWTSTSRSPTARPPVQPVAGAGTDAGAGTR